MTKIILTIINAIIILAVNMRRAGTISPNLQKEILKDMNEAKKQVKEIKED